MQALRPQLCISESQEVGNRLPGQRVADNQVSLQIE